MKENSFAEETIYTKNELGQVTSRPDIGSIRGFGGDIIYCLRPLETLYK